MLLDPCNVSGNVDQTISFSATLLATVLQRFWQPPAPMMSRMYDQRLTSSDSTTQPTEFVSIPEWCRRVGCSLDSGYKAGRLNQIPRLFRIGRLMRVNWPAFVVATQPPGSPVAATG